MSEFQEKGVSNNSFFRSISNAVDSAMGWSGDRKDNSTTRGMLHGTYHKSIGYIKGAFGNKEGANAEHKRAAEQFGPKKGNRLSPSRKSSRK